MKKNKQANSLYNYRDYAIENFFENAFRLLVQKHGTCKYPKICSKTFL